MWKALPGTVPSAWERCLSAALCRAGSARALSLPTCCPVHAPLGALAPLLQGRKATAGKTRPAQMPPLSDVHSQSLCQWVSVTWKGHNLGTN